MKKLHEYTMTERETYEFGRGWLGLQVLETMLKHNISSMEYDVYMHENGKSTMVTTWSKECKEVLKNEILK